MNSRYFFLALVVSLLFGCKEPPEPSVQERPSAGLVSALEQAEVTDRAVEPDGEVVPPSEIEDERQREAILLAHLLPQPACKEEPLATYFFTLVGRNSVDGCGRRNPKVVAAFGALMAHAAEAELPDPAALPLSDRLLSGPSEPGKPVSLGGENWWYYTACQAHQCNTNLMAMLYMPAQNRMVGRLVARCKVWWLGDPNPEQRALIDAIDPVNTEYQDDEINCGPNI